jgi:hypothetical protein
MILLEEKRKKEAITSPLMTSGIEIGRKKELVSVATAFASIVFPVPGGPCLKWHVMI